MDIHNDRKHPHTELDAEAMTDAQLTKHPTLYFEDGNVIVKTGSTLFRVHRTILSKHSAVFRDLFAQNTQTLRGFPSLIVDDGKDDMENLINTIYDGLYIDPSPLTVESFPALAGLLRIATKYQIQRPRTAVIEKLQTQWPSSLEKHDEKQAALRERRLQHQQKQEDLIVHPASVIGLLRECNYSSPELLSPLFYDLSTRVWKFGAPFSGYNIAPLSPADTERFIVGMNKLRGLQIRAFVCPMACIRHPPAEHHRSSTCQTQLLKMWHKVATSWMVRNQDHCHPVEDWSSIIGMMETACNVAATTRAAQKDALCAICCTSLMKALDQSRRSMWNSLTNVFALAQ